MELILKGLFLFIVIWVFKLGVNFFRTTLLYKFSRTAFIFTYYVFIAGLGYVTGFVLSYNF